MLYHAACDAHEMNAGHTPLKGAVWITVSPEFERINGLEGYFENLIISGFLPTPDPIRIKLRMAWLFVPEGPSIVAHQFIGGEDEDRPPLFHCPGGTTDTSLGGSVWSAVPPGRRKEDGCPGVPGMNPWAIVTCPFGTKSLRSMRMGETHS